MRGEDPMRLMDRARADAVAFADLVRRFHLYR
jgi:hypothetical protein